MLVQCLVCDRTWEDNSTQLCEEHNMPGQPFLWPVGALVKSTTLFEGHTYRGHVKQVYHDGTVVVMLSDVSKARLGHVSIMVPNNHITKQ